MVDASEYAESQYLTADIVRQSPTKTAVIIGEAKPEETDFGKKMTANIEIDGKRKIWRLNRDTVANLLEVNKETCNWNGITMGLEVKKLGGKDTIIGTPKIKPTEEELV